MATLSILSDFIYENGLSLLICTYQQPSTVEFSELFLELENQHQQNAAQYDSRVLDHQGGLSN